MAGSGETYDDIVRAGDEVEIPFIVLCGAIAGQVEGPAVGKLLAAFVEGTGFHIDVAVEEAEEFIGRVEKLERDVAFCVGTCVFAI